jgi:hypothetical protein
MTDTYDKENHWYGLRADDDCPVPGKTLVELLLNDGTVTASDKAENWTWGAGDVAAFRITREPRKAREWWINRYYGSPNDDTLFASRAEADSAALDENRIECIHVREVLGDDDAH